MTQFTVEYDYDELGEPVINIDVGPKCTDDICVICMDDLLNGDPYVYCKKVCGRCVHLDCCQMVMMKKSSPQCPYCLQDFVMSKKLTS